MTTLRLCLFAISLTCGGQAFAQAGPSTTYSLTPEQKAAIRNGATEASAMAARAGPATNGSGPGGPESGGPELGGPGPDRQIHGEVGAAIGTNGARGVYGTAAVPLGDNAGAVISFEQSRFGAPRR